MWDVKQGGLWLQGHRRRAGYSLRDLGVRCGVSHQVVSMLERGVQESPRMEFIDAIGRVLGFTCNDFVRACTGEAPVLRVVQAPAWAVLEQRVARLSVERQQRVAELLLRTTLVLLEDER